LDEHNVIDHYITEKNKSFKFNLLPEAQNDEETIRFLRGGFYALSKLIDVLGKIKDPGLITEEMVKIAKITGTNMNKLKIKMGSDYATHAKVVKEAKALVKPILLKDEILLLIATHFDKQL